MNISSALKSERSKLQKRLDALDSAIKILGGKNSVSRGRPGKKRHFSAGARAKMSKAQKTRWAKMKAAKKNA